MAEFTDSAPVVTYSRDGDENGVDAIVSAFSTTPLDLDLAERDPLYEWIDLDALDALFESARDDVTLSTIIWNHPIVITADDIEVYHAE
jgi:hypothetical protein